MSSPAPTPPPPPPSPSPPKSQKLLGNFELPSDIEWSTKKKRTKNSTRVRRIPKPDILDFSHENSPKPSSDYSSRGLSPKLDLHNAHDSSSCLTIGPAPIQREDISRTSPQRTSTPLRLLSCSTTGIPSPCSRKPAPKPSSTSSKVQQSKNKNVKVERESKQKSQEKKKKGRGDEKEKKNDKKIKDKEPNQERRAEIKLPTFSRQLTPQEIADDLYAMTGSRPTRKPTKRPKSVQRQVDQVTPGLWLESIKRNRY